MNSFSNNSNLKYLKDMEIVKFFNIRMFKIKIKIGNNLKMVNNL